MTAIEAMIYCLDEIKDEPTDGEYQSRVVYDRFGYAHWIAWRVSQGKRAKPLLCSGSDVNAFAEILEPYWALCDEVKCNCGASGDQGSCGHSPSCPMKKIEG